MLQAIIVWPWANFFKLCVRQIIVDWNIHRSSPSRRQEVKPRLAREEESEREELRRDLTTTACSQWKATATTSTASNTVLWSLERILPPRRRRRGRRRRREGERTPSVLHHRHLPTRHFSFDFALPTHNAVR